MEQYYDIEFDEVCARLSRYVKDEKITKEDVDKYIVDFPDKIYKNIYRTGLYNVFAWESGILQRCYQCNISEDQGDKDFAIIEKDFFEQEISTSYVVIKNYDIHIDIMTKQNII